MTIVTKKDRIWIKTVWLTGEFASTEQGNVHTAEKLDSRCRYKSSPLWPWISWVVRGSQINMEPQVWSLGTSQPILVWEDEEVRTLWWAPGFDSHCQRSCWQDDGSSQAARERGFKAFIFGRNDNPSWPSFPCSLSSNVKISSNSKNDMR